MSDSKGSRLDNPVSSSATRRHLPGTQAAVGLALYAITMARSGEAGQTIATAPPLPAPAASATGLPHGFTGPPPPVPPAVISRDVDGHATIRAVALTAPLRLDGRLDEAVYSNVPPISDFIQQEPTEGQPATQKTDLWLFFDNDNVYISARCWMSDPKRLVANEMRRDSPTIFIGNDNITILLDTFYDRRNGVILGVNAIGGINDGQMSNESQFSLDWNPVWEVKTGQFENGWTLEAAIPFKSLRYRPGRSQVWGFNVRRFSPAEKRNVVHHAHCSGTRV